MSDRISISAAVEGLIDEAVLRRLIRETRKATLDSVYGKSGKDQIRNNLQGYNNATKFSPWILLVDLDQDEDCAPLFRAQWLSDPAPYLCFRVAVREVEAWMMADRERLARFLSISESRIPRDPESLGNPKRQLVNLARNSKKRAIREDMVPRPESGRDVGPAYTSRLIEFMQDERNGWRPGVAAQQAVFLAGPNASGKSKDRSILFE